MANDCPIAKYIVEWSSKYDNNGTSGDIGEDQAAFNMTDLKCNTQYTVTVTAYTSDDKFNESSSVRGTTNDKGKRIIIAN